MAFPNEEKGSSDEREKTKEFFLKWARMIDPPPLCEDFDERLIERLKHISSSAVESAPAQLVQPPTQDLIEAALDAIGLKWHRDPDSNALIILVPEGEMPFDMAWWFLTDVHGVFSLGCQVRSPIPKSKFPEAVSLCNEYAIKYRFGRFYLQVSEEQSEADLRFESHVDLSDGTTAAFLQTFIMSHISSACEFLGESHVQKRLAFAPARKRRNTNKGVT